MDAGKYVKLRISCCKADLVPSPPPLPPSAQAKGGSSLELPTSSGPKKADLLTSRDRVSAPRKESPLPIRRTPMGAVYRLGSPDDLKPGKSGEAG